MQVREALAEDFITVQNFPAESGAVWDADVIQACSIAALQCMKSSHSKHLRTYLAFGQLPEDPIALFALLIRSRDDSQQERLVAELVVVALHPRVRGRRLSSGLPVADAIVAAALEVAAAQGASEVIGRTHERNIPAQRLLSRTGFARDGESRASYLAFSRQLPQSA